ncbi:MAG TPA: DUF4242 domain-containing protein [Planctomycetota bacterium]|nr:DUF4242 domain-containing protein [Planctomycetota bacterium]
MQTYVIERKIPGAGKLTPGDLQAIARKSCDVLDQLGKDVRWRQSFVTADTIFCIYDARNEQLVREHARRGGFPADRVLPVASIMTPDTAKGAPGTATG